MTIVGEQYTHVVGVDTHTFSMLAAATGAVIGTDTFPTTGAGLSRAVEWIRRRTPTGNVLIAQARRLASAVIALGTELEDNPRALAEHVDLMPPGILDIHWACQVSAAIILASYSHHGRVRSEAAFAALAGASPVPASSGSTNRYRLNRYGDRQLNRATDAIIARTRSLTGPDTPADIEQRTAEGKSPREIRRCLKRFVARQIFRQLQTLMA